MRSFFMISVSMPDFFPNPAKNTVELTDIFSDTAANTVALPHFIPTLLQPQLQ